MASKAVTLIGVAAFVLVACEPKRRDPELAAPAEVSGALRVDGVAAELGRCRPGHEGRVFVEVETSLGVLRFSAGALSWQGTVVACDRLDRSWGGGVRKDGTAYFRGRLAFACEKLVGELVLDCGQITAEEAASLERNRAAASGNKSVP